MTRRPAIPRAKPGAQSTRVIVTRIGQFRLEGDEAETLGAVVVFPDGPPAWPLSVVWKSEVLTLSRDAGADGLRNAEVIPIERVMLRRAAMVTQADVTRTLRS